MTGACPYCNRQMDGTKPHHSTYPTRDHVTPRSRGGKFIVMCCRQCNKEKANLPLQGWLGLLRRRGDPRAIHVQAFIEAHPLRIRPVILPKPLPKPPPNISHDNDNQVNAKKWVCNDCGKRFMFAPSADEHWQSVHYRKAS